MKLKMTIKYKLMVSGCLVQKMCQSLNKLKTWKSVICVFNETFPYFPMLRYKFLQSKQNEQTVLV